MDYEKIIQLNNKYNLFSYTSFTTENNFVIYSNCVMLVDIVKDYPAGSKIEQISIGKFDDESEDDYKIYLESEDGEDLANINFYRAIVAML